MLIVTPRYVYTYDKPKRDRDSDDEDSSDEEDEEKGESDYRQGPTVSECNIDVHFSVHCTPL